MEALNIKTKLFERAIFNIFEKLLPKVKIGRFQAQKWTKMCIMRKGAKFQKITVSKNFVLFSCPEPTYKTRGQYLKKCRSSK